MVADGNADASCADTDGDGIDGLVRLTIGLRDVQSNAHFSAEVLPIDGDIERRGRASVTFTDRQGDSGELTVDGRIIMIGTGDSRGKER